MKIISIGDIHGSIAWKRVDPAEYDKIVFVGDYVDDWPPRTDEQILGNLLDIIEFKKANKDKVVLLLGNHDLQYRFLGNSIHSCSGFRQKQAPVLHHVFRDNEDLFQFAHGFYANAGKDEYLWTHAGVSDTWYTTRFQDYLDKTGFMNMPVADQLNLAYRDYYKALFDVGYARGGLLPHGGPVWEDARDLYHDTLAGLHQIVGHTKVNSIKTHTFEDKEGSLTFVDALHDGGELFYELEIK